MRLRWLFTRFVTYLDRLSHVICLMRDKVMTGNIPFHNYQQHAAALKVGEGFRPERPENAVAIGISDPLWQIVEDCWETECMKRSTIHVVLEQLSQIAQYWVPPSPVAEYSGPGKDDSDESSWSSIRGKLNYSQLDSSKPVHTNYHSRCGSASSRRYDLGSGDFSPRATYRENRSSIVT